MTGQMSLPLRNYPHEARAFVAANPRFWTALTAAALNARTLGRRFSVKRFCENARWDSTGALVTEGGTPYRISNNWPSTFARLLIAEHPELTDTIETRRADCAA